MGYEIIRFGLILVAGFASVCLGTPIGEKQNSQGRSCTLACLNKPLAPVCASDGRTYKNPCMLNAQNCGSPTKLVEELYEGVCAAEPSERSCRKISDGAFRCPESIDPLCGQDKHTYLNYCQLLRLNCEYKVGIGVVHRGACDADQTGIVQTPEVTTDETVFAEPVPESKAPESPLVVSDFEATTESPVVDVTTEATTESPVVEFTTEVVATISK